MNRQDYIVIPYREQDHGSFDEEWPPHNKTSGWWYITGYLTDKQNPDHMYSYQYTVAQGQVLGKSIYILHMALSDINKKTHFFKQDTRLFRRDKVKANYDEVVFAPFTHLIKKENEFLLDVSNEGFELNLRLNKGKGAIWHCDKGVLAMGLPEDPRQRTTYYSYTNLPSEGTLTITDESNQKHEFEVVGKSWFDRQYGPFRLLDRDSHWEWFSLRFFDDEEVMLFYFPETSVGTYQDGTYIDVEAQTTRLQNYIITPQRFVKEKNYIFSYGWDIVLPGIKEEKYGIRPLTDGQFNVAYFELLAEILTSNKECVGYAFVELICGARNDLNVFRQIGDLTKKKNKE